MLSYIVHLICYVIIYCTCIDLHVGYNSYDNTGWALKQSFLTNVVTFSGEATCTFRVGEGCGRWREGSQAPKFG